MIRNTSEEERINGGGGSYGCSSVELAGRRRQWFVGQEGVVKKLVLVSSFGHEGEGTTTIEGLGMKLIWSWLCGQRGCDVGGC